MKYEEKNYRIELPNTNIGRSRYAEIPNKGQRTAKTPQSAVSRYVMGYCTDNEGEGRIILRILGQMEGGLESFAKVIETQPNSAEKISVRNSPNKGIHKEEQMRLF